MDLGATGPSRHEKWVGEICAFTTEVTDEDHVQPKILWDVLGKLKGQQSNLVYNVSVNLKGALSQVQEQTFGAFL